MKRTSQPLGLILLLALIGALALSPPSPAAAFSPTEQAIANSCYDNQQSEFKKIKQYPQVLSSVVTGRTVALYCGRQLGNPQHGYNHIKAEHVYPVIGGDWAYEQAIVQDIAGPAAPATWEGLMDMALAEVTIFDTPGATTPDSRCYDRGIVAGNLNTGEEYIFGVRFYVLEIGQHFTQEAIGSAFPAESRCNRSPWPWQLARVSERAAAAETLTTIRSTCDSVGCRWVSQRGTTVAQSNQYGSFYTGGPIGSRWNAWRSTVGYPTQNMKCGLVRNGCFMKFAKSDAAIHSSPDTGAHVTKGQIGGKWRSTGSENGTLGYPATDEKCGLVGGGCFNNFEKSDGAIYYSSGTGAHFIKGQIGGKWRTTGSENGTLGYPTTDEKCGLVGGGCFNNFEKSDGAIYYSSDTGAHYVKGRIAGKWRSAGAEKGVLGYPSSDERCGLRDGGCNTHFAKNGSIYHSKAGTYVVKGPIREFWADRGWQDGSLGYPIADEQAANNNGRLQRFQGAAIYWSQATGAMIVFDRRAQEELVDQEG